MYRFKRGIPVPYDKQGYIYFMCKRYRRLGKAERALIREACESAGEQYKQALFDFVTGSKGAVAICSKYYISESTLERVVKRFYIIMADRIS